MRALASGDNTRFLIVPVFAGLAPGLSRVRVVSSPESKRPDLPQTRDLVFDVSKYLRCVHRMIVAQTVRYLQPVLITTTWCRTDLISDTH
jgi:hypothetical protein